MKSLILFFWAAIIFLEFFLVNGDNKVNTLLVGKNFHSNSTLRTTIILNDIQYPTKVKLTMVQKIYGVPENPTILTKYILVNPHQATDIDLEIGDLGTESGSYDINVFKKSDRILSERIFYRKSDLHVMINPIRPIQYTESSSLWIIMVTDNAYGENLVLNGNDIDILLYDSNRNDAAISIDYIHFGYAMIVKIYLDYKIVPGDYEMVAIYKSDAVGKTKFQVFEYKPGPFNVHITTDKEKRFDKLWLDINIVTKKFNGDTVEGDLTIDFGNSTNFTVTLPISGQTSYSVDADETFLWSGEDKKHLEIEVWVRDKRTGETNFAKLHTNSYNLEDKTEVKKIKEIADDLRLAPGVPYIGKFEIHGFDEDHVRNSNTSVKFIFRIGNEFDSQNFTKIMKIGKFVRDKVFETNVEHMFTSNETVYYTVHYENVDYNSSINFEEATVNIKARKVEGNRFGNYEIFCSEPMNRVTYVLRTANSDLIMSKTIRGNNKQIKLTQIDDDAAIIEFLYYSEEQKYLASYELRQSDSEKQDANMEVDFRLINDTSDGVIEGEKLEMVFQSKSAGQKTPLFLILDHELYKLSKAYNYMGFDESVAHQSLIGNHGIVDFDLGSSLQGKESETLYGRAINQEGKYEAMAIFVNKNGIQEMRTSLFAFAIRQWFTVKIHTPKVIYHGESCEIELVVTNLETEEGMAKINLFTGSDYPPWELKLAGNESKIIKFIVNGTIARDINIHGRGEISYADHSRATYFSISLPVVKVPLVRRDYHYINIISRNETYSFDQNLLHDEQQHIDIYFGGRLIHYLSQMRNEDDKFDRLVSEFVTSIFNNIHKPHVSSSARQSRFNVSTASEFPERLIFDLLRYQYEDGSFGPQPQRTDIWLTAYIVRMILMGQSENFFEVDNNKLQKSINSVLNSVKSGEVGQNKMLKMSTRSDIVQTALILMMLEGWQHTRFSYSNLIQESLSFIVRELETNDIIAKVLAIHVLIRFHDVGFSTIKDVYPEPAQLKDMLNALAKQENGMMWWEVSLIEEYSKEELDFVSLELTSLATITKGTFSITELEPIANYLLSRYSKNVPLVYWEALITSQNSYPEDTIIEVINGEDTNVGTIMRFYGSDIENNHLKCSEEKCAPGGFITTSTHQLEEKFDSNLTSDLQVRNNSVEVCVKHSKDSGEFIIELYLPTGVCTDLGFCGQHYDFGITLVGGHGCRTIELHRRYQVWKSINRLPVVVFEKNNKDKHNIYYADYSGLF